MLSRISAVSLLLYSLVDNRVLAQAATSPVEPSSEEEISSQSRVPGRETLPSMAAVRGGPVLHTYALLVGVNPGGDGQTALRFAEQDARHMAAVLTELGRVPTANLHILLGPNKTEFLEVLGSLRNQLAKHQATGEQAQLVLYYSGHARAHALYLGRDELMLSELRQWVEQLPATLKLVVLDACQSGAFSRVKGAEPSVAFSHNSVQRLQTQGVAIMASSTGSELSQESEALESSYFTHHLIVGLRGAGDFDHDGIVSLAEAYRYAYGATLVATSRTAVGGQHATLETSLTGQGEVPLTYPAEASAQLEFGRDLEADVLVQRGTTVFAELHKANGSTVRLALSPGVYGVMLRRGSTFSECALSLDDAKVTRVVLQSCSAITQDQARSKGYTTLAEETNLPVEAWSFELGFGLGNFRHDEYTRRLQDFGFVEQVAAEGSPYRLALAVSYPIGSHLSLVGDVRNFDSGHYKRDLQSTPDKEVIERFDWYSYALSGHLRAHVDIFRSVLRLYSQLGLGVGLVHSSLEHFKENHVGPVLSGSAGVFLMPWRDVGFLLQVTYAYAPVLGNELEELHDSGGLALTSGFRLRTWSTR